MGKKEEVKYKWKKYKYKWDKVQGWNGEMIEVWTNINIPPKVNLTFKAIFKCKMKSRCSEEAANSLRTYFRLLLFTIAHKTPLLHFNGLGSP
jgi:hypothetical protein